MKRGRRELQKKPLKPKKMTVKEIERKKKIIIKITLTILALIILFIIAMIANNYIILDK